MIKWSGQNTKNIEIPSPPFSLYLPHLPINPSWAGCTSLAISCSPFLLLPDPSLSYLKFVFCAKRLKECLWITFFFQGLYCFTVFIKWCYVLLPIPALKIKIHCIFKLLKCYILWMFKFLLWHYLLFENISADVQILLENMQIHLGIDQRKTMKLTAKVFLQDRRSHHLGITGQWQAIAAPVIILDNSHRPQHVLQISLKVSTVLTLPLHFNTWITIADPRHDMLKIGTVLVLLSPWEVILLNLLTTHCWVLAWLAHRRMEALYRHHRCHYMARLDWHILNQGILWCLIKFDRTVLFCNRAVTDLVFRCMFQNLVVFLPEWTTTLLGHQVTHGIFFSIY